MAKGDASGGASMGGGASMNLSNDPMKQQPQIQPSMTTGMNNPGMGFAPSNDMMARMGYPGSPNPMMQPPAYGAGGRFGFNPPANPQMGVDPGRQPPNPAFPRMIDSGTGFNNMIASLGPMLASKGPQMQPQDMNNYSNFNNNPTNFSGILKRLYGQ